MFTCIGNAKLRPENNLMSYSWTIPNISFFFFLNSFFHWLGTCQVGKANLPQGPRCIYLLSSRITIVCYHTASRPFFFSQEKIRANIWNNWYRPVSTLGPGATVRAWQRLCSKNGELPSSPWSRMSLLRKGCIRKDTGRARPQCPQCQSECQLLHL